MSVSLGHSGLAMYLLKEAVSPSGRSGNAFTGGHLYERGGHGIRPWLSRSKEFKRLLLIGH